MRRSLAALIVFVGAGAAGIAGQSLGRLASHPAALVASPVFYHGRQVAVRGRFVEDGPLTRLEPAPADPSDNPVLPKPIYVFWKDGSRRDAGEVRGQFWDLGRLTEDDSRFAGTDFRSLIDRANEGRWPAREEIFVLLNAAIVDSSPSPSATIRTIVMAPNQHDQEVVTVSGRFRGRNLYGDVPSPLNKSKWDFVLHSADAALWVSGVRPRGKGFDLDPGTRADTGRWLEVTGTVHVEGAEAWLEAKSMELTTEPTETPVDIAVPAIAKDPPPEVIFSAPVPDEVDVDLDTRVRIQFSRDMDKSSFRDQVTVTYIPPAQGQAPSPPKFSTSYNEGLRSLEIRFEQPLERFQTVKVELLGGIAAGDKQSIAPWTLVFSTGS